MNFIKEFKGIVWPSKKRVIKEYMIVFISSIIGIIVLSLINLLSTELLSFIGNLL